MAPPMPSLTLPGSGRLTSRLGFGCGSLMRIPSQRDRDVVLQAAYEAGIRHFDVARMYGLGQAEAELGRFLGRSRGDVTVGTKLGIEVGSAGSLSGAQSLLRRVIALHPAIRALARKVAGGATARKKDFGVAAARASVAQSLAELAVDRVDLLFLHEPELSDLTDPLLLDFLEERKASGVCGAFGVSGETEDVLRIAERHPSLGQAVQVRHDAFAPSLGPITAMRPAFLGIFGVLHRALPATRRFLSSHPDIAAEWSRTLDADLGAPEGLSSVLLACGAAETSGGMVLFSTTRPSRIASTARGFSALLGKNEALLAFARLLRERLPPPG